MRGREEDGEGGRGEGERGDGGLEGANKKRDNKK
jgi:hypothetical protein